MLFGFNMVYSFGISMVNKIKRFFTDTPNGFLKDELTIAFLIIFFGTSILLGLAIW
jgi:hypothetical protein